MKRIKCLVPFVGIVSMAPGEEREVSDEVAADLVRVKYVKEIKTSKNAEKME